MKMKKTKRLLILLAAMMLACVLAVTAFATDGTSQSGTTLPVIGNDGIA